MKKLILAVGGRARGFTLIELVFAMAILGILSAIAIPSYRTHIQRGHRATAQAVLTENAQFMERYATSNGGSYAGATVQAAVSPKGATGSGIRYNVSLSVAADGASYTLSAAPANAQSTDSCGTMTLTNTGAQTAAKTDCW